MKKAIVTVDLGYGDSGKGATVDAMVRERKASLVVRYSGGANCGHNVVLPDGRKHCFSQFGSGTLAGADTLLDRQVIVNLPNMVREAHSLRKNFHIDVNQRLSIHRDCRISTSYHVALNRATSPLGETTGVGIGQVRRLEKQYAASLTVGDVLKADCLSKLERIRDIAFDKLTGVENGAYIASCMPSPRKELEDLTEFDRFNVVDSAMHVLNKHQTPVIFEAAQGVLLDERYGFHPHNTWSTVTARDAMDSIEEYGAFTEVSVIGILRAYSTRHGNGFFPSWIPEWKHNDPGNPDNHWQGAMRFGAFDLPMLKFALNNAGAEVDYLALNHVDEVQDGGVCVKSYGNESNGWQQTGATFNRHNCRKIIQSFDKANMQCDQVTANELIDMVAAIKPIGIIGRGRTHVDREFVGGYVKGSTADVVSRS
jgi:adenylosuccinate synthase